MVKLASNGYAGANHSHLTELLIAVDDATGTVSQAVFHSTEDTRGYLVLLEGLFRQWGIPLAIYSDRHAAFKYNAQQKPVPVETTRFAGVMRELGVQRIFALSPQTKGRVERILKPLRDRLVTELRLAGASLNAWLTRWLGDAPFSPTPQIDLFAG